MSTVYVTNVQIWSPPNSLILGRSISDPGYLLPIIDIVAFDIKWLEKRQNDSYIENIEGLQPSITLRLATDVNRGQVQHKNLACHLN